VGAGTLLAAAAAIAPRARAAGALFLVNDRPDVARLVDADGVHLGQDDVPVPAARHVLGAGKLVGVSTHDPGELAGAVAAGADYVGVGPVYATTSKAGALAPRGPDLVRAARRLTTLPLVAIGGITPDTAAVVLDAGADAVAMIGALVRAADPEATVRTTVARLAARRG
jgi:thiamine-phosphate pyrophosphorylase